MNCWNILERTTDTCKCSKSIQGSCQDKKNEEGKKKSKTSFSRIPGQIKQHDTVLVVVGIHSRVQKWPVKLGVGELVPSVAGVDEQPPSAVAENASHARRTLALRIGEGVMGNSPVGLCRRISGGDLLGDGGRVDEERWGGHGDDGGVAETVVVGVALGPQQVAQAGVGHSVHSVS